MVEQKYKPANKAFTLLEVLVAIAILSIGITAVLKAFSFSARVAGYSADIQDAVFLAKGTLQELEFKEMNGLISLEPTENSGEDGRFQWKYTIETGANLYLVKYNITWMRSGREENLAVETYLRK